MGEELLNIGKLLLAFLITMPIWFSINLLLSPFRAYKEIGTLGKWIDRRYNYNSMQNIYTYHITPKDNGKIIRLKFRDANPNSFVWYKVEYDGGIAKVWIDVHENNAKNWWDVMNRNNQSGGIRINKNREAKLVINCPSNSDLTTARVYIRGWEA